MGLKISVQIIFALVMSREHIHNTHVLFCSIINKCKIDTQNCDLCFEFRVTYFAFLYCTTVQRTLKMSMSMPIPMDTYAHITETQKNVFLAFGLCFGYTAAFSKNLEG